MSSVSRFGAVVFNAVLLASLPPAVAHAEEMTWDARGKPLEICKAMQKNVRYMYNARGNGATQTYAEIKAYMRAALAGKGEPEDRLLAAYENILARIESDEFSPPRETPGEGQLKARNAAGTLCLKAFPGE